MRNRLGSNRADRPRVFDDPKDLLIDFDLSLDRTRKHRVADLGLGEFTSNMAQIPIDRTRLTERDPAPVEFDDIDTDGGA
jgi:hypothetical protein